LVAAKGARMERMPNISAAIVKTRTREKFSGIVL